METKLKLEHLAPYLPYGLKVQYVGVINGKELGKWDREYNKLNIFDANEEPRPKQKKGEKIGLIKKVEIYLDYWKLRVGNGHKNIFPNTIGKDAFLILRPLSDLTKEQFSFIWENETDLESMEYLLSMDAETFLTNKFSYIFWNALFENKFDIFNLIEQGLAIPVTETFNPYK
jgi:hypothetical protein